MFIFAYFDTFQDYYGASRRNKIYTKYTNLKTSLGLITKHSKLKSHEVNLTKDPEDYGKNKIAFHCSEVQIAKVVESIIFTFLLSDIVSLTLFISF